MWLLLACNAVEVATPDSASPVDEETWLVEEADHTTLEGVELVDLFSDDDIWRIDLEFDSGARSDLRNDPYDWAEGLFTLQGVSFPIGAHVKGSSTYSSFDDKPSLKLDFGYVHEGLRYGSIRRVNLHNQVLDPIVSSEWLTYGFYRAADLPAARVGYARLYIDGEDRGIYTIVEDPEDDFLRRWFDDPDGNLYENASNYCDFTSVGCFDREESDEGDDSSLEALIEAANASRGEWLAGMQDQMDWDRYVGFLAMERTIAHWDSYSYDLSNYRVYHDPSAGWSFLPWSADLGFGYRPWSYPDCGKHGVNPSDYDMGLLASGCEQNAQCISDVLDKMEEYADLLESMEAPVLAQQAMDRVHDEAASDPDHHNEMDHFEEHGECIVAWLDQRPDEIRAWVAANR
ncbi:MAG: hypothetical protein GY913_12220 [Proteobacteria bacterium]|nr:hypothetical protein [Pseudomonadota bacterium]MCP4917682.1 hypothetical protein [Pseudomonadota bacterium]